MKIRITGKALPLHQGVFGSSQVQRADDEMNTNFRTFVESPRPYIGSQQLSDIMWGATNTPMWGNQNNPVPKPPDVDYPLIKMDERFKVETPWKDVHDLATKKKSQSNLTDDLNTGLSAFNFALAGANQLVNHFDSRRREREFKRRMYNDMLNPIPISQTDRGDYTVNEGLFRPDDTYVPNKGMYTNKFYSPRMIGEMGGTLMDNQNDTMKIRITGMPSMEYGGQMGYGLDMNRRKIYSDMPEDPKDNLSNTVSQQNDPDSRYVLEAEKDETIKRPDGSFATFEGQYHSNGGVKTTKEQTPEGSYIYSRVLKERRPEVLKALGVTGKSAYKKGISFADLTKPYNTNKYVAILNDKYADPLSKNTAQMMKDKFDDKHGLIALAQESFKGFPEGVPDVAKSIMPDMMDAAYGGFVPKYQTRGGVGKKEPWEIFTKQMMDEMYQAQQKYPGLKIISSPRIQDPNNRDNSAAYIQAGNNLGMYGDIEGKDINEFVARHGWYFSQLPKDKKWNPRDINDVRDFQTKYNQIYQKYFGKPYFSDDRKISRVDGLMGEYTYNSPGIVDPPPSVPVNNNTPPKKDDKPGDPKKDNYVPPGTVDKVYTKEPPFKFMSPDIRRMVTARMYPPEMILPHYASFNAVVPNPVFEDWRAKAAGRQAMYNTAARTMGNYGPTQGLAANLSFMAGQQGDPLIQDIAQTETRNVAIANPFAMAQAEVLNKENEYNTQARDKRYQGWAVARQNYRNAQRNYRRDIDTADIAGWKNRSKLHMLNMTNPYYFMDPTSGRSIFKGGKGYEKLMNSMYGADPVQSSADLDKYPTYYNEAIGKGLDPELAKRWAYSMSTSGMRSRSNPYLMMQQQPSYYSPMFQTSSMYQQDYDDEQ